MILSILIYIFIGIFSGIFIGTLGVGSGTILIPVLSMCGFDIRTCVAIVLAHQIVPQSYFGVREYYKKGYYAGTKLAIIFTILGTFLGIHYGSKLSLSYFKKETIERLFFCSLFLLTSFYGIFLLKSIKVWVINIFNDNKK